MRSKTLLALGTALMVAALMMPATAQAWWVDGGWLNGVAASHIPMTKAAAATYGMKSGYVSYCAEGARALDNPATSAVARPDYHFNIYHTAAYNYPHTHSVFWDAQDTRIQGFDYWMGQAAKEYSAGRYTTAAHKVGNGLHCIEDISGHGQMAPSCHLICGISPDDPSKALPGMTASARVANGNAWVRTYMAKAKARFPKLFN
jgi:hypothetical protein